jgi:hypothetical protein
MLRRKPMKRNRIRQALVIVVSFLFLRPHFVIADQYDRLESEGHLIYQQLKKSKICKESEVGKGWTDCHLKAYGTEVLLVGATGTDA